jgi:hypothetical protein
VIRPVQAMPPRHTRAATKDWTTNGARVSEDRNIFRIIKKWDSPGALYRTDPAGITLSLLE